MNEFQSWVLLYLVLPIAVIWIIISFIKSSRHWIATYQNISGVDHAVNLNVRGIELYNQGFHDEALRVFENAVESYPDVAFLRVSIAKVFMDQGRYSKAEYHLRKAIEMPSEPATHRDTLVNLAGIKYAQKHFLETTELLEQSVELYEADSEIYYNLGAAFEQLGEWDKALHSFEQSNTLSQNPRAERDIKRIEQLIIPASEVVKIQKSYQGFMLNPPLCCHHPLSVAEAEELNRIIHPDDGLVFFAGAGISYPQPACLPLAGQILKEVFHFLFELDKKEFKQIMKLETKDGVYSQLCCELLPGDGTKWDTLPFFATFQVWQDLFGSRVLRLVDLLEGGRPNLHHAMLAYALREGHTVITTNFDQLIEKAYQFLFNEPIKKILISDRDFQYAIDNAAHSGVLVKIHGDKNDYNSLALTLEGTVAQSDTTIFLRDDIEPKKVQQQLRKMYPKTSLSIPKALYLQTLLKEKKTVIIGYRGADTFDIMPILNVGEFGCGGIWVEHSQGDLPGETEEWQKKGKNRVILQSGKDDPDKTSTISKYFLDRYNGVWESDLNADDNPLEFSSAFINWIERLRMRPGDGLNFAARLFSLCGNFERAKLFYDGAVKKYEKNQENSEYRWLEAKSNCGYIQGNLGNEKQAAAVYDEVIEYLDKTGKNKIYPIDYANALLNKANLLLKSSEDAKAGILYLQAMQIAKEIDDKRLWLYGTRIAATRAYCKKDFNNALQLYNQVLQNAITIYGDLREAYEASMGAGMSFAMLGNKYKAIEMISCAENYAMILSDQGLINAAHNNNQFVHSRFQGKAGAPFDQQLRDNARAKLNVNDKSRMDLIYEYLRYQKHELCLETIDCFLRENKDVDVQALLLFIKSNVHYQMMDFENQLGALKMFSEIKPEHPLGEHNLGVAYWELKNYVNAEKHFLKAIDLLHGEYPLARCNLGSMYVDLGRLDDAKEQLSKVENANAPITKLETLKRKIIEQERAMNQDSLLTR